MLSNVATAAIAAFFVSSVANASTTVTLTPGSGHPGQADTVAGAGFGGTEAVDLYFDTGDTALLVTGATGAFSTSLTVPTAAQPDTHYVTAIGRRSGDAAQYAFTVSTNWAEQGFGAARLGWNPYENTVNISNVGTLGPLWTGTATTTGATPTIQGTRVFVATTAGVQALSTYTGGVLWTAIPSEEFYASPAVVGNSVYVGSETNGVLYALNAATGAALWSTTLAGGSTRPLQWSTA
jgi:outer membrane protein assembly factor BamB